MRGKGIHPSTQATDGYPYRALAAAIIHGAWRDLRSDHGDLRESARDFFFNPHSNFPWLADGLGLEIEVLRSKARERVKLPRRVHKATNIPRETPGANRPGCP